MFEIGFSEIIVIAMVAVLVIGPDKLPKIARTYGALYGRLQRYMSGLKQDIDREVALDAMKKATAEAQQKMLAFQAQYAIVNDAELVHEVFTPEAFKSVVPASDVPTSEMPTREVPKVEPVKAESSVAG